MGHLDLRELGNYVKMVSTEGNIPGDTGRKLNVHKTFRRRPGCLLNILCTFNLRHVSTGISKERQVDQSRIMSVVEVNKARFIQGKGRPTRH